MRPVQPGWVVVPEKQAFNNEWYHLVGWEGLSPVIAMDTGVALWRDEFGEDKFCVATHKEWTGE